MNWAAATRRVGAVGSRASPDSSRSRLIARCASAASHCGGVRRGERLRPNPVGQAAAEPATSPFRRGRRLLGKDQGLLNVACAPGYVRAGYGEPVAQQHGLPQSGADVSGLSHARRGGLVVAESPFSPAAKAEAEVENDALTRSLAGIDRLVSNDPYVLHPLIHQMRHGKEDAGQRDQICAAKLDSPVDRALRHGDALGDVAAGRSVAAADGHSAGGSQFAEHGQPPEMPMSLSADKSQPTNRTSRYC